MDGVGTAFITIMFDVLALDFSGSTSLLFGTGCVDRSGSLSGGAFNQLKLVTLNIVKTFLY